MNLLRRFWAGLTQIGPNSDFVNAGDDVRYNPFGIPAWLQRKLSYKDPQEPNSILITFNRYFWPQITFNIRRKNMRYTTARSLGMRYDKNWGGFIGPEAAIKTEDHVTFY